MKNIIVVFAVVFAFTASGFIIKPANAYSYFSNGTSRPGTESAKISDTETAEREDAVNFKGQIRELSYGGAPTIIIVRSGELDRTVEIPADTKLIPTMDSWMTGDQVQVIGKQNANTSIVTAKKISNLSIRREFIGVNGTVEAIDIQSGVLKMKDARGKAVSMKVTSNTKIVVGGKNPANIADLQPRDKIRARIVRVKGVYEARMIVAIQRGKSALVRARNYEFSGVLKGILNEATEVPATLEVELKSNAHLKKNDERNALGADGSLVRVAVTADTILVRRFEGKAQFSEMQVGDELKVVGWLNDDNVLQARLIKNASIWQNEGVAGVITGIYLNPAYMVVQHGEKIVNVQIDKSTEFWKTGKKIGFEEIRVRDNVRIRGVSTEGTAMLKALKVLVVPTLRDANLKWTDMGEVVKE